MAKGRTILTNFSKGELDPLVEGRPDLAAYFEGAKSLENWLILRQGGVTRRPGLRFVAPVDNTIKDTILVSFEASVDATYEIEFGDFYVRFIKNKQLILTGSGIPYKIASPYSVSRIRSIHFTQSVDVLFLFHEDVPQYKLSRISDTNWSLIPITYDPPPSFEADTDISNASATLTMAATTGNDILFTASSAVFLVADVGRQIIFGSSRAIIKTVDASSLFGTADIIDPFPNTEAIAPGNWFLRLSPQTTLDPTIKEPIGAQVTLVAGASAFRAADVGKYIAVYAGIVKITHVDSLTTVRGTIMSIMEGTDDANPAAAPAGAWTLEQSSWSVANGFPRTGEFYSGRLAQAATAAEPTTIWFSDSDNFDNYAIGVNANQAIEYTIRARALNRIEWLADNKALFIGTAGSEHKLSSGKEDEPIGGDKIPLVEKVTSNGSSPIQPVISDKRTLFMDRSRKKLFTIAFDIEQDSEDAIEITGVASHITGSGIRLGPMAFAKRPDPRLYMVREDGTLVTLTYFVKEKVIGFTRIVTDGTFEAVSCIPQAAGKADAVYCIVKRTIQDVTTRYIEVFEDEAEEMDGRPWLSIHTDSAIVYDLAGVPTAFLTGLGHLEGKVVDVITDGSYRGQKVVHEGQIELNEEAIDHAEVGLHYRSSGETMRPSIEGQVVEGLPRTWITVAARLHQSMGGRINGERLQYPAIPIGSLALYTGDRAINPENISPEGRISFEQDEPYPMTILALFGEIEFGDHA